MNKTRHQPDKFEALRRRAEALLKEQPKLPSEEKPDILELIQELSVHQAELEIQNEELRQAQREISDLHREFEALYEFTPCGYLTLNADGFITHANLTAVNLLGVARNRLLGSGFTRFIGSGWENAFLNIRNKAVVTGEKQIIRMPLKKEAGSPVWVRADIEADRHETGAVAQWRVALIDITEQKLAEEALREREEVMRYIIKHDPNAIAVYDRNLHYIAVSDRYLQDYRVTGDDIQGKHHYEVFPEMPQRWKEIHERVIHGATERNDDDFFERSDGSITYNRWECRPWYLADGSIGGMITYTEVTTERKLAEKALRESEQKYRRLAENSPDMIFRISLPDGEYEYVSPASNQIFGYPPKTWYDNPIFIRDIIHPDDRHYFRDQWARLLEGDVPPFYEYRIIHKSGDVKSLHQRNVLVRDETGRPAALEGIVTDLTELKTAERKLKEYSEGLEKMVAERTQALQTAQEELLVKERLAVLGHFAGSLSHELRNPLAVIDSSVYILKMKLGGGDDVIREQLGRIDSNVRKSIDIIQSLVSLSRMEKPKTRRRGLTVILNETLRSIGTLEGLEVSRDYPEQEIFVDVDLQQIRMALKNLIQNAVQAMNENGALAISVQPAGPGEVEIAIKDTGPGIPLENIEKIFEPLFTTKVHGIGFGLSITKMIIENHGGTIRAESEPGSGAAIIIDLPIAGDQEP